MVVGRKSAEVLDHEPEEVSTSQNLNIAKNNITKNSHSNYSKYMCILLYSTSLLKCERNHPLLHCETRASPSMDDNSCYIMEQLTRQTHTSNDKTVYEH